ncbi:MAG: nucleotidyltransferase family protein [Thermodesulfobacteriota bacterium]
MKPVVAGVVLAAGASRRMGAPKAALVYEGRSFARHVVEALRAGGVGEIVVVTGHAHDATAGALPALGRVTLVRNPEPERGQLSSLKIGLEHLATAAARVDAVVVALVDHPTVRAATVARLLEAADAEPRPAIVVPVHERRRGHPVLFARAVWDELLATPDDAGARAVVRAEPARVREVAVADPGILADVDTPDDFARLRGRSPRA